MAKFEDDKYSIFNYQCSISNETYTAGCCLLDAGNINL